MVRISVNSYFYIVSRILFKIITSALSWLLYCFYYIRWKKPARPDKILWISPNEINRTVEFTKLVKYRKYYLNGIISGGSWGRKKQTVNKLHTDLFEAFELHFKHNIPFEKTEYFSDSGKKEQLCSYKKKYCRLYNEIKEHGFKLPGSVIDEVDYFKVCIATNGEFMFMTGKHRLAIAKLFGDKFKIPVRVSHRHRDWQYYRDKLYVDYKLGKITKNEIADINHPDLMDLVD
jgi:hypothetical protein